MKRNGTHLDEFRKVHPMLGESKSGSMYGYFQVPVGKYTVLNVISSGEKHGGPLGDWEHVSISLPNRCPTWEQMCVVKDLFWHENETVVQFHPARSEYVNVHPYCLHLWKPPYKLELPPTQTMAIA